MTDSMSGGSSRVTVESCKSMLRYEMARRGIRGVRDEELHAWGIAAAMCDDAPVGNVVRNILDEYQGLVAPWSERLDRLGASHRELKR